MDLMGATVRDNLVRSDRRPIPPNRDSDESEKGLLDNDLSSSSNSNGEGLQLGFNNNQSVENGYINTNTNTNTNPSFYGSDWGYSKEEKLEEILMKKLELLYNDAIGKLVGLGYDEDVALKGILKNGHCYGNHDPLTNVMNNTLGYLNRQRAAAIENDNNFEDSKQIFANLTQLIDFSMACLVCLLRRVKSRFSRGDAMWCLIMSELHVGRASTMEVPFPKPNIEDDKSDDSELSSPPAMAINATEDVKDNSIGVTPDSCKFHGGWGFGNRGTTEFPASRPLTPAELEATLQTKIIYPKYPVLTPTMDMVLKTNVALFAKEYRENQKRKQVQSEAGSSSSSGGDSGKDGHPPAEVNSQVQAQIQRAKNKERSDKMWKKFYELSLEENGQALDVEKKDDILMSVIREIKDLEKLVKERKDWAHQKAMQAARKLCHDLTELKMLRMEKEDNQRLKMRKPTEDPTMRRLSEMENALRKASGQVDRANMAVRRLEVENAEIRAEMEASKLSASESVNLCLEVARREKKYLKRLLAWEKQRAKLQEDLTTEKQKIMEFQEELLQAEEAKKTAEVGFKQVQKAKDLALTQVEEERRLKETADSTIKRRYESLRSKIELDFQRYKDDLQRLEQELTRIKTSTDPDQHSTYFPIPVNPYGSHHLNSGGEGETIARMLNESDDFDDGIDRACILCSRDEVSVVFLPCAHQVLCVGCNDGYGKKGKAKCPACRVPIEQRIRVFGASS